MPYYLNTEKVTLHALQKRIEETDLVPSRSALLENIGEKFKKISARGIKTLADLRKELKNAKKIPAFSKKTGIDAEYLTLLRREIEGYFPKAFPLSSFDWLDTRMIDMLYLNGIENSVQLFDILNNTKKRSAVTALDIDDSVAEQLSSLVGLTRIQWVSPTVARMLVAAGYTDAKSVSGADAETLCADLERVNSENGFFKGKTGLRDVNRLIKAASYVS